MIEKNNRYQTKHFVHLGQQSLHADFHCQSKWRGEVLYGEKTKLSVIYKISLIQLNVVLYVCINLCWSVTVSCSIMQVIGLFDIFTPDETVDEFEV